MATVTVTGNTIRGATTSKDNRTWQIRAVAYQYGGTGGGVITPGADWTTLYPVDGVLTFTAEAGSVVEIKTPEGVPYRVRIPAGNAGLWDVIEAGVAYQPDVAQDTLNRAVANAAPGFIAAELELQTADAITTDLAARRIAFSDLGAGEGYFSVGGVPVSGTLVPPAATWSGVAARPSYAADSVARNGVNDDYAYLAADDDEALAMDGGLPLMLRSGIHRVGSNLTIDSPVWFLPGAVIKPDGGVTVTLAGGIVNAPMSQIFDGTAGGAVFPEKVDVIYPEWWGATGDGVTDDTDAVAAAVEVVSTATNRGVLQFLSGRYVFGGIVVNPNPSPGSDGAGRGFTLRGAGPARTVLVPRSGTEVMFHAIGGHDISAMVFEDATVEITEDRPYDVPAILVERHRAWRFNRFDLNAGYSGGSTGTFIALDASYEGSYHDSNWNRGKWCVPLETRNTLINPASGRRDQCDTYTLSHIVNNMTFGPIHRGPQGTSGLGGEVHGIKYDHYKCVDHWSDGTDDWQSTLSADVAVGATTITVDDASGFSVGDPIHIGTSNTIEINKVTVITGDVLTLAQPLVYAHVAATNGDNRVILGAFGMALGDNVNMLTVDQAHFERQYFGIRLGNVNVVSIDRIYSFATNVLAMIGAVKATYVGACALGGTAAGNNLIYNPDWETSPNKTATNIQGPFWNGGSSVPVKITPDAGALFHKSNYRAGADQSGGVLQDRFHSDNWTDKIRSVTRGRDPIVEVAYETYDGRAYYSNGVSTNKISDANENTSLVFNATADAVNYLKVYNAATGGDITLAAAGSDARVGIILEMKGAGVVGIYAGTGQRATIYGYGPDDDHDLNLTTKGAGIVRANADPVGVLVPVPSTPTDPGVRGQWAADNLHHYTCTDTDTWRRVAHTTW